MENAKQPKVGGVYCINLPDCTILVIVESINKNKVMYRYMYSDHIEIGRESSTNTKNIKVFNEFYEYSPKHNSPLYKVLNNV